MKANKPSLRLGYALSLIAMAVLLTTTRATAQTEKFLHSFSKTGKDGYQPSGGLVSDASGNLYGVTSLGGPGGCGAVFEFSPRAGGGWSEKVLYSFKGHDGRSPQGSVIFDAAGNLYGVTAFGGANSRGTVFELSPNAGGWTEKVLYSFGTNSNDGNTPNFGVAMDPAGNLYGVTTFGGIPPSLGIVFELSPSSSGTWAETILWNFDGIGQYEPQGPLVFDSAGNLYGVTLSGVVYKLSPSEEGWSQTILYGLITSFAPAGLTIDSAGNLYGVGFDGGASNEGLVFELSPSGGTWTESTLYSFNSSLNNDGAHPAAALTLDAAGNLFGTTAGGGGGECSGGCGTVFELTPSGGSWTETILHRFGNGTGDGQQPRTSVLLDAAGNLYGTTVAGGAFGVGMVFEIVP